MYDQRQDDGRLSLGVLIRILRGFIIAFNILDSNTSLLHLLAIAQTGHRTRESTCLHVHIPVLLSALLNVFIVR